MKLEYRRLIIYTILFLQSFKIKLLAHKFSIMLNDLYLSFVFLPHSVFAKIYRVKKTRVIYNPRHDIGPKSNIWKDRYDATGKKIRIYSVTKIFAHLTKKFNLRQDLKSILKIYPTNIF